MLIFLLPLYYSGEYTIRTPDKTRCSKLISSGKCKNIQLCLSFNDNQW